MFKKLNYLIETPKYRIGQERTRYGITNNEGRFKGIRYMMAETRSNFMDILPPGHSRFLLLEMAVTSNINPHTDDGVTATINFYFDPQNAVTRFYKFKNENPRSRQTHGQNANNNGKSYGYEDLECVGEFVAKENEIYLLDVTKPHSVNFLQPTTKPRVALVLQTNKYSFDELAEVFSSLE